MIIRPSLRTWRSYAVLVPATIFLVAVLLSLPWLDWPRLLDTGLILPWIALSFVLFVGLLFPFALLLTEAWEVKGSNLIHHLLFAKQGTYPIAKIQFFAPTLLRSGRPSLLFMGIRPLWLKVDGKVRDRMLFPYLYQEDDLKMLKKELKKTNPNIEFTYRFF